MKTSILWKRIIFAVLAVGMTLLFPFLGRNTGCVKQVHAQKATQKALEGAIPVEIGKGAEGMITKENSVCYFKFTVPRGIGKHTLTFSIKDGTEGALNACMLDEKGNPISIGIPFGSDDTCLIKDMVDGKDFMEFHAILKMGATYYIKVFREQGDVSGTVTLSVSGDLPQAEEIEATSEDTLEDAILVELDGTAEWNFKKQCYECHYFKFTVPKDMENKWVVIDVTNYGDGEIHTEMLDEKGQSLLEGKRQAFGYSFVTRIEGVEGVEDFFVIKPGSTYYIKVENEELFYLNGKVDLSVTGIMDDNWGSIEKVDSLMVGKQKNGELETNYDRDCYLVTLPQDNARYDIHITGNQDIRAGFVDANQRKLDETMVNADRVSKICDVPGKGQQIYIQLQMESEEAEEGRYSLLVSASEMQKKQQKVSAVCKLLKTGIRLAVRAEGSYRNWDGVSNVDQFVDEKGEYCFAYDKGNYVTVVKTRQGTVTGEKIKLKKKHALFGGVTCDSKGNYYVVTGRANETKDTEVETIFVSKYDSQGNHIKTVGDNGSSSLGSHYNTGFYTKNPFEAGNCDIAVNGTTLTVNYARAMYNGHQSNSVFSVDTERMEKVFIGENYNSHSFAQRVIPYKNGFLYASEGDCYNRAFNISRTDLTEDKPESKTYDIFHFWVKKGTLNRHDMGTLNNNFAHMGGIASAGNGSAALVGTSAKALNKKAKTQNEQLFIQVFHPEKNLNGEFSYTTFGRRSGYSGGNGNEAVMNVGVQWLTNYKKNVRISNPQVAAAGDKYVILFERSEKSSTAVYYMVLDSQGDVIKKATCFSKNARLNPCRMPVYAKGSIYWSGNQSGDSEIYTYQLKIR